MCGKNCGLLWVLPGVLFLLFSVICSDAIELTEAEFNQLSENLTQLETLNSEQARSLEQREITLEKLQAQVEILEMASMNLARSLNATAVQLQRADASLTRAGTYLSERDAVHRKKTLLTGLISVLAGGFIGLVSGVVFG